MRKKFFNVVFGLMILFIPFIKVYADGITPEQLNEKFNLLSAVYQPHISSTLNADEQKIRVFVNGTELFDLTYV